MFVEVKFILAFQGTDVFSSEGQPAAGSRGLSWDFEAPLKGRVQIKSNGLKAYYMQAILNSASLA